MASSETKHVLGGSRLRCALALSLVVASAAITGCLGEASTGDGHGHDDGALGEQGTASPPTGPIEIHLMAETGTRENEMEITPNPLRVPYGKNVEIEVHNNGKAAHTFTVHGYGLDTARLMPGEGKTLAFFASKIGSFEIMCDEPGHYGAGMKASLVVA